MIGVASKMMSVTLGLILRPQVQPMQDRRAVSHARLLFQGFVATLHRAELIWRDLSDALLF